MMKNCPICGNKLSQTQWSYAKEMICFSDDHMIREISGFEGTYEIEYGFGIKYEQAFWDTEIIWKTRSNDKNETILWIWNKRQIYYYEPLILTYFEPDFSDLPKLHNKISIIRTFQ